MGPSNRVREPGTAWKNGGRSAQHCRWSPFRPASVRFRSFSDASEPGLGNGVTGSQSEFLELLTEGRSVGRLGGPLFKSSSQDSAQVSPRFPFRALIWTLSIVNQCDESLRYHQSRNQFCFLDRRSSFCQIFCPGSHRRKNAYHSLIHENSQETNPVGDYAVDFHMNPQTTISRNGKRNNIPTASASYHPTQIHQPLPPKSQKFQSPTKRTIFIPTPSMNPHIFRFLQPGKADLSLLLVGKCKIILSRRLLAQ